MKRCPECRRDYYDDSLLYCLDDGTALLDGPASLPTADEPRTAILREVSDPDGGRTAILDHAVTTGELPHGSRSSLPLILGGGLLLLAVIGAIAFWNFRGRGSQEI